MLFTSDRFEGMEPVENKQVERILKKILNGGCSKSKYIHEVNLEKLKECAAKYKVDRKTLYSFRFNFGSEEMFLNPIFLSDCLKFASINVIYFNTKWSPVVFKNSGEELRRFGILFPVKKNS